MQPVDAGDFQINAQAYFEFFNGAQPDEVASNKAGRPIFKDCEMVRIRWQGDTKKWLEAPASDRSDRPIRNREDNSRYYPKWKDHPDLQGAYEAFKKGQATALNGTPIDEATFLSVAQRLELKAVNIVTVEGLASVDPSTKLGSGLSDLRRKADDYLKRAKGAAIDAQHAAERDSMQKQINDLKALVEGRAAPVPAKTGSNTPRIEVSEPSPFDSFSDEELRGYLLDANKQAPHNRCNRSTLIRMCDEANARLKRESEGAQPEAAAA